MINPSKDLIAKYLDCVFGYMEGWIAFRSYPESGSTGKPITEWISIDDDYNLFAENFANKANANNYACYVIPGTVSEKGKGGNADVKQFGNILVDIDSGDTEKKLEHLTRYIGEPSMTVESGGITEANTPKMHCYWKLSEAAEGDDIKIIVKIREIIALKVGGDIHFKSAHQPIRIAGSIYHKTGEAKLVNIRESNDTEYHLEELLGLVDDMPVMEGVEESKQPSLDWTNFNDAGDDKPTQQEIRTGNIIREGGKDHVTRFEAVSSVLGGIISEYHKGLLSLDDAVNEAISFNQRKISPSWDQERLKVEFNRLLKKHQQKYGEPKPFKIHKPKTELITGFRGLIMSDILDEELNTPNDIATPRILIPGGISLFVGAPKVGKSDFLLSMFIHFAAGEKFLFMEPREPLRTFYMQLEIREPYIKERIHQLAVSNDLKQRAAENLIVTPRMNMVLNDQTTESIIEYLKVCFGKNRRPDIICIDPIRNLMDMEEHGSENDNSAMMSFFKNRVEYILESVNPDANMILSHHTSKASKHTAKEETFGVIAGAGAIRGFYDTGILMLRPNEASPERELHIELRNGAPVQPKIISKNNNNAWIYEDQLSARISREKQGRREDAERTRKKDIILQLIHSEAAEGYIYTSNQFGEKFEGKHGLGSEKSIRNRISVLSTKGYIKFIKEIACSDYSKTSSRFGYLCVEGMEYFSDQGELISVPPTYYKHPSTGACLEVENPDRWIYPKEENNE